MHEDLSDCFWYDSLASTQPRRPPLAESTSADVAIIGAGYTGLWTAYHLTQLKPDLSVVILEAEHAGYGASGRNGGWLMGAIEGLDDCLAACDPDTRATGHREVHGIVTSVGEVISRENIDCDFAHGGAIYAAARYPEQLPMARNHLARLKAAGHGEDDYRWLEPAELSHRINIRAAQGAIFTPHVAAIQPAKLVAGLVTTVLRRGVRLYEQSRVTACSPGGLLTAAGQVKAPVIISATEGYASDLLSMRSYVLPFQSGMVATEPLPPAIWNEIGLEGRPVVSDYSRLPTYLQRTRDDRLVFGARGDYRYGGRPISHFPADDPAFAARRALLCSLFPVLEQVGFTHAWGGTLGISRCFAPHVVYDEATGMGTAGGYVGEGVGASFLFGKTLAEMILQCETERTRLPWAFAGPVRRALRRWEPEPLRWLGFKTAWSIYRWEEALYAGNREARWRKRLAHFAAESVSKMLS